MTACWICGGDAVPYARLAPHPFVECQECGFVFRDDRAAAAVNDIYEGGDYVDVRGEHYLSDLEDRRSDARVRLAYIAPYARGRRLLDIGAAGGAFVSEAGQAGYAARGVEPTPAFAALARDTLGVDVRTATIEEAGLEDGALDVATMWHVLEHIPEPLDQIRRVRSALAPGGLLAIEVPNAGGIAAHAAGTGWASLEPDVHVGQYAPPTLRALLERAGLRVEHIGTVPITPYLPLRVRYGPAHLVFRARYAAMLRSPRSEDPEAFELLRAVARRPADA